MPKQNQKDIEDVPLSVRRALKFEFVEKVDEVFKIALTDFEPHANNLEGLLQSELKRAKNHKRGVRKKRKKTFLRIKRRKYPKAAAGS